MSKNNRKPQHKWSTFAHMMARIVPTDEQFQTDRVMESLGGLITGLKIDGDNRFIIDTSVHKLWIEDQGQSCCESRYMSTDDKLEEYIGAVLHGISLDATIASESDAGDGEHDIAFLRIHTGNGTITIKNHNYHNGYYGGFSIVCS